MTIVVGLGNPGLKYKKTRHNVGFLVLDQFRKEQDFPKFKFQKKVQAEVTEKDGVVLAKPQTYMNASGKALKLIFNLQFSNNLIVVQDDLDIPLGEVKISQNKSAGGHKGVQSIIDELGTQDFKRVRVGIKHEAWNVRHEAFVLEKFSKEEWQILESAIKKAGQAILELLAHRL